MKYLLTIFGLFFFSQHSFSQIPQSIVTESRQGEFYFYWGWNRGWFSQSELHFTGDNYDFTLSNVVAHDRPSAFNFKTYFSPARFTIPQYNFRIGYFFKKKYSLSIGMDHMKYIVKNLQPVKISGHIHQSGTPYDGNYDQEDFFLDAHFLQFEHTDGLNYLNLAIRRDDHLLDWRIFSIHLTEGLGAGMLIPRTNSVLFEQERYDEFHLAGYGLNAMLGFQVFVFRHCFIQTELKGGLVHMPDIRTTPNNSDKASQRFFFGQFNVVFGATLNSKKK